MRSSPAPEASPGLILAQAQRLGDARYAMLPTEIAPLWGVEFDSTTAAAAPHFITTRAMTSATRNQLLTMLLSRELNH